MRMCVYVYPMRSMFTVYIYLYICVVNRLCFFHFSASRVERLCAIVPNRSGFWILCNEC